MQFPILYISTIKPISMTKRNNHLRKYLLRGTLTSKLYNQTNPLVSNMGSFGKYLSLCLVVILLASSLWMVKLSDAQTTPNPAATFVTGVISSDTTWTKTNSPYNITGAVIPKGVTVTIEPGTVIYVNAFEGLNVNGTLRAIGTSNEPIVLNGDFRSRLPVFGSNSYNGILSFSGESQAWDGKTGTGCIIENANIVSLSIYVLNGTIKLNNNIFSGPYEYHRLWVEGGNSIITNNRIFANTIAAAYNFPESSNNTVIDTNSVSNSPTPTATLTPTATPNPSVPEFSWLTILPLLICIPIVLIIIRKKSN
jgi:hypothetical protein